MYFVKQFIAAVGVDCMCLVLNALTVIIFSLRFNGDFPGEPRLAGVY